MVVAARSKLWYLQVHCPDGFVGAGGLDSVRWQMLVPKNMHRRDTRTPGAVEARQTFVVKDGEVIR